MAAGLTGAATPPHLSRYAPQNVATFSIEKVSFGGGVGNETRTVRAPFVGIGTAEPASGERIANEPVGTGTVTDVDTPCSSV
jgi:hypothetical protein